MLATFALLVHQFAVVAVAAAHVSGAPAEVLLGPRLDPFKAELVRAPALALLVLLAALTLAVFKPWGPTRRAGRRQQERSKALAPPGRATRAGVKAFLAGVALLLLGLVVLALTGHVFKGHGA